MSDPLLFSLSYEGAESDQNEIDFYDVAQALIGFQRSLALTTHLVVNGEIITQAPSLKGARLLVYPPSAGSWKILSTVALIGTVLHHIGTAPADTVLGHLVRSTYDYVISETLGFHVDFDKTLGEQYDDLQKTGEIPSIKQSQIDSLIEKCEGAILQMHRPIVNSQTARTAHIYSSDAVRHKLNALTYDYVRYTEESNTIEKIKGKVSSYNINTYNGRLFVLDEDRPISFQLADECRDAGSISLITRSLTLNAQNKSSAEAIVKCEVLKSRSRTGRLKSLLVIKVNA